MSREALLWVLRRMGATLCRCCGRQLTNPDSIMLGMGKKCAEQECTCNG